MPPLFHQQINQFRRLRFGHLAFTTALFVFFFSCVFVRISCWGWIFATHGGFLSNWVEVKDKQISYKWMQCQISTALLSESLFLFSLKFEDILKVVLCPRNIVLPICNFLHRNFIREIIRRTIQYKPGIDIENRDVTWVQNRWSTFFKLTFSDLHIYDRSYVYLHVKGFVS